jgi:hypothetical protein
MPEPNYSEAKVPAYTLPDPLLRADGSAVTREQWPARRRELLDIFAREVYGRTPANRPSVAISVTEAGSAFHGKAVRTQLTLTFGPRKPASGPEVVVHVLSYRPSARRDPVPAFLSLNFQGNHAVADDPAIGLSTTWMRDGAPGVIDHHATERSRGADASRWPVETILDRGYALVTAYYGDLDPDFDDGFRNGVHPLFYGPGQTRPATSEWGSIGAWAWGLSRILDALERNPAIDARRVAVMGHSRLGKAALWAAAQDERFALVVSNESGCGGAALSKRIFGETVKAINDQFPHWFAGAFKKYNAREADLPVDQHELLALIAPRPLYVASAAEDQWADPRGEFLSAVAADPVYQLLGTSGLGVRAMPAVNHPVGSTLRYHVRAGEHDVLPYDWQQYLAFADEHLPPSPPPAVSPSSSGGGKNQG